VSGKERRANKALILTSHEYLSKYLDSGLGYNAYKDEGIDGLGIYHGRESLPGLG